MKRQFLIKIVIWKVCRDVCQVRKTSNILLSKEAYGMKITEYYFHKVIFFCFSLPWNINKHKVKQILKLAKTWLFGKGAFQTNVFCSVLISMPAQPKVPLSNQKVLIGHSESTHRTHSFHHPPPPPPSLQGGGGVILQQNFQKRVAWQDLNI